MSCINEELSGLLPFYVAGTLTADERARVDEHLKTCAACQAELKTLAEGAKVFSNYGIERISQHIGPEQLVEYGHDRATMAREVVQQIERHLRVCRSCAEDVALIEDMNRALAPAVEPPHVDKPWFARLVRLVGGPPFALKPWVAAAAALMVIVVAATGYFTYLPRGHRIVTDLPTYPHFTLTNEDSVRGGPESSATNVITLKPQQTHFFIDFAFEIKIDPAIRYDLEITDAAGKTVLQRSSIQSVNDYGFFKELFARDKFSAGSYTLTVKEVTISNGTVTRERRFPFRLSVSAP